MSEVGKVDTEDFDVPVVVCENQAPVGRGPSGSVDIAPAQLVLLGIEGRLEEVGEFIEDVWDLAGIGIVVCRSD